MKNRKSITVIILTLSLLGLYFLWTNFLWKVFKSNYFGSYPYAETWCLKVKEKDLIEIIKEVKKEHSELMEPNIPYFSGVRHKYWYKFTFYYQDTNQDVYTWTRGNKDSLYTTFAFIAIATHIDSLTPIKNIKYDRREINRDFEYYENKAEIKKFEDKILKLIELKLKKMD